MRQPVIREGEILGTTWFAFTRQYGSDEKSLAAFERLTAAGKRRSGKLDLGVYRHHNEADTEYFISVVGLKRDTVQFAGYFLGGEEYELPDDILTAMVYRRARVVDKLMKTKAEPGVHEYHYGEGTLLDTLGQMDADRPR